ncbi:ABC transporter ATP-binding protein [Desulfobulbus elongatus]|uniref:ABC transporter ATP-binding protein n=1 Tax=Desulfobulbus elongatus TaxID=53332 RepID=UPI000486A22A|nr:ABC transporter ATP-binding protein [Desulfobulbus elongatus]
MTNDPILELRQVRKVFPEQGRQEAVVALDGLDLILNAGEFVAIVGASGSGKSTLVDLVAGFTQPTSGTVTVKGKPVRAPGPDRVVVFQDHAVFPWYTALDNVAYGLRRQGMRRRRARERAREALCQVGLQDFAHAYPAALSGGMRQRVALARALVLRPDILLLDEPFASLDAVMRSRLQDELTGLWRQFGWTVLFVTHILTEAVYLADRVVVLDRPPSGLRAIERIGLPRPRNRLDARLAEQTEELRARMGGSLDTFNGETQAGQRQRQEERYYA